MNSTGKFYTISSGQTEETSIWWIRFYFFE